MLKETNRIFEHWTAKIGELQMPEFEILADDDDDDDDVNQYKVDEVLRVLEADEIDGIDVKKYKADIAFLEGASARQVRVLAKLLADSFFARLLLQNALRRTTPTSPSCKSTAGARKSSASAAKSLSSSTASGMAPRTG